jgi:hypothetical protein
MTFDPIAPDDPGVDPRVRRSIPGSDMEDTPAWAKWMLGLFAAGIVVMFSAMLASIGDMRELKGQNLALQTQLSGMETQISTLQQQVVTLYDRLVANSKR